ncbi:HNH endonuclease [Paenibacillus campi]|uniref:HNH endonuclease n=1 Tax=Paenibacillus campi TaxID=3106031 RepID=UPI002AFE2538|nr:HNH endonuclease [Paenibacillus sp. SGZ-1014]
MVTWKEDIIDSLKTLGGEAHLDEICEHVVSKGFNKNNTVKQSISRIIQSHSSDSSGFNGKEDLFYSVNGLIHGNGDGFWGLNDYIPSTENVPLTEDDISFPEGKQKLRLHIYRERNPNVIKAAKEKFKSNHDGRLFCEICEFDYSEKYGELGEGYIEGHHTVPISELEENSKTRAEDIVLVCANCHRMLHRKRPWLSKNELKNILLSK